MNSHHSISGPRSTPLVDHILNAKKNRPTTPRGGDAEDTGRSSIRRFIQGVDAVNAESSRGSAASILFNRGLRFHKQKQMKEALAFYRRAAAQGHLKAMFNIGTIYVKGENGVEQDLEEAVRHFRLAARKGDKMAQFCLGMHYRRGLGVEQSDKKAIKYLTLSAEQNVPKAMHNLAVVLQNCRGPLRNEAEAVKWYMKASQLGEVKSSVNLGVMYAEGRGIPKDEKKAYEFYAIAAQQGDPFGMFNMSNALKNGCGVEKDDGKAVEYLRKASDNGHAKAQFNLAMRAIKKDSEAKDVGLSEEDALQLLEKAAKAGDARAKENLTIATARITSRSETSRSESRAMPTGRRPPPLSEKGKYVSILSTKDDSSLGLLEPRPTSAETKLPEPEPIVVVNPTGKPTDEAKNRVRAAAQRRREMRKKQEEEAKKTSSRKSLWPENEKE